MLAKLTRDLENCHCRFATHCPLICRNLQVFFTSVRETEVVLCTCSSTSLFGTPTSNLQIHQKHARSLPLGSFSFWVDFCLDTSWPGWPFSHPALLRFGLFLQVGAIFVTVAGSLKPVCSCTTLLCLGLGSTGINLPSVSMNIKKWGHIVR